MVSFDYLKYLQTKKLWVECGFIAVERLVWCFEIPLWGHVLISEKIWMMQAQRREESKMTVYVEFSFQINSLAGLDYVSLVFPLYISAGFGIKPHTQIPSETLKYKPSLVLFTFLEISAKAEELWLLSDVRKRPALYMHTCLWITCADLTSFKSWFWFIYLFFLNVSKDSNISERGFLLHFCLFFFWFASYFVAEVRPPICYLLSYLEERETDLSGIWCTDYSWLGWLDLSFRLISLTYRFSFIKMWFWANNLESNHYSCGVV